MKFFIIIFSLLSYQLLGQTNYGIFSGKVTDEHGVPLISANIVILETNDGAATDKNGNF